MSELDAARVSAEAVRWAMRMFLGRDPRDLTELEFHRAHSSLESLRLAFARTREFREYYGKMVAERAYAAPLFLLAPPADASVPWVFAAPTLAAPVSQLCTQAQMESAEFAHWSAELGYEPRQHRKLWEFCYITAVMESFGVLRAGARAIGFGVGKEPLPSLLARRGLEVLATDAPAGIVEGQGWSTTNQHASDLDALHWPALVELAVFRERVAFQPVDMNAIPAEVAGYDVCWSSCALEHLGSIDHGLRFIEASLGTLKPGGLAVHTTEFNLASNEATFEQPGLSLFRKKDIEALAARLTAQGHTVVPLNFHPGDRPVDAHIDLPPYALPHLKLEVGGYVTTSIGIVVRKAA